MTEFADIDCKRTLTQTPEQASIYARAYVSDISSGAMDWWMVNNPEGGYGGDESDDDSTIESYCTHDDDFVRQKYYFSYVNPTIIKE